MISCHGLVNFVHSVVLHHAMLSRKCPDPCKHGPYIFTFARRGSLSRKLCLDGGEGYYAYDVLPGAAAGKVVYGFGDSLKHGAVSLGLS